MNKKKDKHCAFIVCQDVIVIFRLIVFVCYRIVEINVSLFVCVTYDKVAFASQ